MKDMKENQKVIQRVYNLIYSGIGEQFKIHPDSLPETEKDEIEKDFRTNRNELLII